MARILLSWVVVVEKVREAMGFKPSTQENAKRLQISFALATVSTIPVVGWVVRKHLLRPKQLQQASDNADDNMGGRNSRGNIRQQGTAIGGEGGSRSTRAAINARLDGDSETAPLVLSNGGRRGSSESYI